MSKKVKTVAPSVTEDTKLLNDKQLEVQSKEEIKASKKELKASKKNIKAKKDKKKDKETRAKKLGKKTKETFAELKKVSWPNFGKVAKQTGVVLAVVSFFTLVLFGMDYLLRFIYTLIIK